MAYSGEQLDKGKFRNQLTPGEKKENKKQHKRKNRRYAKNIDNPHPIPNKYRGGWAF